MAALSFRLTRNDISPALSRLAAAAKRPEPVFRAMGTTFLSLTMGNFKSPDYRPTAWPAKKDGTPSHLQKNMVLCRAFHLEVTSHSATVSNPMIYAAIHQFGSRDYGQGPAPVKITRLQSGITKIETVRIQNIPARPFFPVEHDRLTPKAEEKIGAAGKRAIERQVEQ